MCRDFAITGSIPFGRIRLLDVLLVLHRAAFDFVIRVLSTLGN